MFTRSINAGSLNMIFAICPFCVRDSDPKQFPLRILYHTHRWGAASRGEDPYKLTLIQ
jgi:hypothetical protein